MRRVLMFSLSRPLRASTRLRRWNSTHDGPPVSETNRTEATMKRFWKTVSIGRRGDSYTVLLDNRPLKTPSGNLLLLPPKKSLVATLVAAEWDNQETVLKHHALPMTSLVSRAIDSMSDDVTFYEDYPPQLVDLQAKHWDPLLAWARSTFGIEVKTFDSVLFNSQPEATKAKLDEVLSSMNQWEMAAMERATYSTKSLLIALGLVKNHLSVEQASLAAQVEVASQIARWGEVEDTHDVDFHDVRRQLGSCITFFRILSPSHHLMAASEPPAILNTPYTPFYCEENIWHLCSAFLQHKTALQTWAVFVSNESKTVALWQQKLGEPVVVWDYHVVAIVQNHDAKKWVYDYDTRLPFPSPLEEYIAETFRRDIPPAYKSLFRIVPGQEFVDFFASDRSHMMKGGVPPPPYDAIRGKKTLVGNNLMDSFVSMDSTVGYGEVVELDKLLSL
ncbi:Nt-Gln-amidase domain-containing protein [Mycena chlorophos]|uniref:Nt-Gln-amidase domain-containing protein n=1 Tax=Mycena chlorophos TaxID=658473 RepID=A0A8H6WLB6_MYCCL|nr:Nt-Gln-amidase domain-containing protein [Mycena chlorophos]